jgi:hypothetical protein
MKDSGLSKAIFTLSPLFSHLFDMKPLKIDVASLPHTLGEILDENQFYKAKDGLAIKSQRSSNMSVFVKNMKWIIAIRQIGSVRSTITRYNVSKYHIARIGQSINPTCSRRSELPMLILLMSRY